MKGLAKHLGYRMLSRLLDRRRATRAAMPVASAKRILLSEIALLGDVVSTTASLAPARRLWPGARIDVLVPAPYACLVASHPAVDEVLTIDGWDAGAYLRALRAAHRRRYDLVVALSTGLRNAGMALGGTAYAGAGYLRDLHYPSHFLTRLTQPPWHEPP